MATQNTLEVKTDSKKVIISRTKLSDGYNYYLMLLRYSSVWKDWYIVTDFNQGGTIVSKKEAIKRAKAAIL